jgi:hypothetical protein
MATLKYAGRWQNTHPSRLCVSADVLSSTITPSEPSSVTCSMITSWPDPAGASDVVTGGAAVGSLVAPLALVAAAVGFVVAATDQRRSD